MNHLVIVITNSQQQPIGVRVLPVADKAAGAFVTPHTFPTEQAARAYQQQLEQHYSLPAPLPAKPARHAKRGQVRCLTDPNRRGELFRSAAAAARAYGVTTSAITRHLRDPANFPEVRQHVFERIN